MVQTHLPSVRQHTDPTFFPGYTVLGMQENIKESRSLIDHAQSDFFNSKELIAMSSTRREEYIEKIKLQLDEANLKMNELEAKAQQAKADAREKYDEEMVKLRQKSDLATAKLEELKAAGEDSWDAMVAEMEKIRAAFVHSFNYFKSQV